LNLFDNQRKLPYSEKQNLEKSRNSVGTAISWQFLCVAYQKHAPPDHSGPGGAPAS
jgi:hypothetical protein